MVEFHCTALNRHVDVAGREQCCSMTRQAHVGPADMAYPGLLSRRGTSVSSPHAGHGLTTSLSVISVQGRLPLCGATIWKGSLLS